MYIYIYMFVYVYILYIIYPQENGLLTMARLTVMRCVLQHVRVTPVSMRLGPDQKQSLKSTINQKENINNSAQHSVCHVFIINNACEHFMYLMCRIILHKSLGPGIFQSQRAYAHRWLSWRCVRVFFSSAIDYYNNNNNKYNWMQNEPFAYVFITGKVLLQ